MTKGVVPQEAWLALPSAQRAIASMRSRQPEQLRDMLPTSEPGGLAGGVPASKDSKHSKPNVSRATTKSSDTGPGYGGAVDGGALKQRGFQKDESPD